VSPVSRRGRKLIYGLLFIGAPPLLSQLLRLASAGVDAHVSARRLLLGLSIVFLVSELIGMNFLISMTMEKRDSYLYATVPLLLFSFVLLFASIWNLLRFTQLLYGYP
jgi:hypothetical protein